MEFRTGNGAGWLDFLATRLNRYRAEPLELLPDAAALRSWFVTFGLSPRERITDADAAWARELREALHAVTVSSATGQRPRSADLAVVRRALDDDAALAPRIADGAIALTRATTARQVLGRLARDAVDVLGTAGREHVHTCSDPTCALLFYDATGRRRWCSDERCGVRARVRAHRARQQAATPSRRARVSRASARVDRP